MSFCWVPDENDTPSWELTNTVEGLQVFVWININAYHVGDEPYKMAVTLPGSKQDKVECYYVWGSIIERVQQLERTYSV